MLDQPLQMGRCPRKITAVDQRTALAIGSAQEVRGILPWQGLQGMSDLISSKNGFRSWAQLLGSAPFWMPLVTSLTLRIIDFEWKNLFQPLFGRVDVNSPEGIKKRNE